MTREEEEENVDIMRVFDTTTIIGALRVHCILSLAGNVGELLQQSDSATYRAEAEAGEARGVPQG